MDVKTRLFRKPVTTISWIALMLAMSMLLGVGANLLKSASGLFEALDEHHTTIAIQTLEPGLTPSGSWEKLSATLSEKEILALEALDPVIDMDMRMLTGAYIPELDARIALFKDGEGQKDYDWMQWDTYMNESYNEVILTGTVTHTWYEDENTILYDISELVGIEEPLGLRQFHAIVEIDEIIVAHEDYSLFPSEDFPAYSGKVHVQVLAYNEYGDPEESGDTEEEDNSNFFEVGSEYIFSGTYNPWIMGSNTDTQFPEEISDLRVPILNLGTTYTVPGEPYKHTHCLKNGDSLIYYPETLTEWAWEIPRIRYPSDKIMPAATKLTGTVEELLETDALWVDTVELFEGTLHTFPVLGTEKLESMYAFNRNEAVFIEGRSFTQEEYDAGAKVCVIEESIAQRAGIHAGDTVNFSQFICGRSTWEGNMTLQMANDNGMLINPGVGRFPFGQGLVTENEAFTVVGIYKLSRTWDTSSFSFTPNTIFIPQKAQIEGGYGGATTFTSSSDGGKVNVNGTYGIFMSIIIENGRAEEFLELAQDVVPNDFYTFDQGYANAMKSVQAVEDEAWKLISLTAVGWILLLALYVLLYQNREAPNLGIIRSLGGRPKVARCYLFGSGMIVSAIGILTGTLISSGVTKLVSQQLAEFMLEISTMNANSGGMELDLESVSSIIRTTSLSAGDLLALAALQLVIVAVVLWLHAVGISCRAPRKLLSK